MFFLFCAYDIMLSISISCCVIAKGKRSKSLALLRSMASSSFLLALASPPLSRELRCKFSFLISLITEISVSPLGAFFCEVSVLATFSAIIFITSVLLPSSAPSDLDKILATSFLISVLLFSKVRFASGVEEFVSTKLPSPVVLRSANAKAALKRLIVKKLIIDFFIIYSFI